MSTISSKSESEGAGSVAEVLMQHIEVGNVTRKAIARAGRVSQSTAWRWVSGEQVPDFNETCLLLERLPAAVACDLYDMIPHREDCDEEVSSCSLADLVEQIARGNGDAQQQLVADIVKAARDHRLDSMERAKLLAGLNEIARQVSRSKQMLLKTRGKN